MGRHGDVTLDVDLTNNAGRCLVRDEVVDGRGRAAQSATGAGGGKNEGSKAAVDLGRRQDIRRDVEIATPDEGRIYVLNALAEEDGS